MTPVPGCSGVNDGKKYCIDPDFEGDTLIAALDDSSGTSANTYGALGLCQGNCDHNDNCKEGLVCFRRNKESVPGCTGSPVDNYHYCIYPQLNTTDVIDSLNNDGAFLRIRDSGALTVFTVNGTVIWDTENTMNQTGISFDPDSDISLQLENQLHFAGTYRHSEIHFDFDSDARKGGFYGEGGFHVNADSIEVFSTTSIAYKLIASYPVSIHSRLSFDITLANDTEAIAICVDDGVTKRKDIVDESINRAGTKCLAIGGTAIAARFGTDIKTLDSLAEPGIMKSVDIALTELFFSRLSDIDYIGIMQVASEFSAIDDTLPSLIQNINFYNKGIHYGRRSLVTSDTDPCVSTFDNTCTPGCMAATTKEGLHHKLHREDDFCISIANMLTQLTKNEEEPCLFHNECRSGLCQSNKCHSRVS